MTTNLRIFLAIFLLAHGFIHASLSWVPAPKPGELKTPFFPAWWNNQTDPSWPIQKLGLSQSIVQNIGWSLWLLTCVAAVVAVLGLLLQLPQLWIPAIGTMAVISIILILAYWHPWYPIGLAIDLALLASLVFKIPSSFYLH